MSCTRPLTCRLPSRCSRQALLASSWSWFPSGLSLETHWSFGIVCKFCDLVKAEVTAGFVSTEAHPNKPTHFSLVAGVNLEYLLAEDVASKDLALLCCCESAFVP